MPIVTKNHLEIICEALVTWDGTRTYAAHHN